MKKKSNQLLFLMTIGLLSLSVHAQVKIGDNPTNIHSSSSLELESTNKGFLPPRMTTAQRDAIPAPAAGLVIYNLTTNCLNHFVGPNWFESCGVSIPLPPALGSAFTSFSNGAPSNENFSANTTCQDKLISAGYSSANCSGSLTIGANTYNVVLINGQCWMQSNLKEPSTAPCADAINTGCNIWLDNSIPDIGAWGYYNMATPDGSAGWGTTELAANEGLLYQWSAAMNGSTTERAQGVCPTGWHIPSDCEWKYLEHGQGMSIEQQNVNIAFRSTTGEGDKLRSVGGAWNNSSGFSSLLSGTRLSSNNFAGRGSVDFFWTSSQLSPNVAQSRVLSAQVGVNRTQHFKYGANSIRCLKN